MVTELLSGPRSLRVPDERLSLSLSVLLAPLTILVIGGRAADYRQPRLRLCDAGPAPGRQHPRARGSVSRAVRRGRPGRGQARGRRAADLRARRHVRAGRAARDGRTVRARLFELLHRALHGRAVPSAKPSGATPPARHCYLFDISQRAPRSRNVPGRSTQRARAIQARRARRARGNTTPTRGACGVRATSLRRSLQTKRVRLAASDATLNLNAASQVRLSAPLASATFSTPCHRESSIKAKSSRPTIQRRLNLAALFFVLALTSLHSTWSFFAAGEKNCDDVLQNSDKSHTINSLYRLAVRRFEQFSGASLRRARGGLFIASYCGIDDDNYKPNRGREQRR